MSPVTVEVGEEYSYERTPVQRHTRLQPLPSVRNADIPSRVFEIDQMRQLAGCNDVEKAIAVDIADCNILSCTGIGAFCEGYQLPDVGIGRTKCDTNMPFSRAVLYR
jgi:hypothetical protein